MRHQNETVAIRDVQMRLTARFPDLEVEVVEAAVRVAYTDLQGPIRDYVPVLVEHAARDRLQAITHTTSDEDDHSPVGTHFTPEGLMTAGLRAPVGDRPPGRLRVPHPRTSA